MKTRFAGLCQLMALTLLVCCCFSVLASAQVSDEQVTPRYVVLPPKPLAPGVAQPDVSLLTWNGSFTYQSHQYNYVMVGNPPATGSASIITHWIIPVKIVLSTGQSFDPFSGGPFSPVAMTIRSPIYDKSTDYVQGGVDLGATQYLDAYQRGNFWQDGGVSANPNYHVYLGGPTAGIQILPELTLNVPAGSGHIGTPFGFQVAEVDINYFDTQISNYMTQHSQINAAGFPMFIVENTYLTEGGCCIGGYHSANGQQSYGMFDYDTHPGVFSQDVSALSHEVGEWMDDPLTNGGNGTPCGIMENGDPLEGGSSGHPYGTWVYPLNNFNYHLQDLVFLRYFGADTNISVNSWWSFQNFPFTTICQNGS
jgi:hypothetical protein